MPKSSSVELEIPRQVPWFLYLIECLDGSIYTGITTDVAARYAAHACGNGARYTRSHPPARLLASVEYPDHSSALKAEYRVKQLKSGAKRRFVTELSLSATGFTAANITESLWKKAIRIP